MVRGGTNRQFWIAALIGAVVFAILLVINPFGLLNSARGASARFGAAQPTLGGSPADHVGKRMCSPQPPDYPGCSATQINDFEDGTDDRTQTHYSQDRWGQKINFDWSHLGPAHNNHLRDLYDSAVVDYRHAHNGDDPRFATWVDFKHGADCSGGGIYAGAWTGMCLFNNAIDNIVPDLTEISLTCSGWGLVASGVTRSLAVIMTTVAPEAAAGAGAGTAVMCALSKITGMLGIPGPGKTKPTVTRLRSHLGRTLDRIVPFATAGGHASEAKAAGRQVSRAVRAVLPFD